MSHIEHVITFTTLFSHKIEYITFTVHYAPSIHTPGPSEGPKICGRHKEIEDLLKEKGACFWDSQNLGGGKRDTRPPPTPRYRRP